MQDEIATLISDPEARQAFLQNASLRPQSQSLAYESKTLSAS